MSKSKLNLTDLPRGAFAVPEDRKMRVVIEKLRLLDRAARELSRRRYEKYARLAFTAGAIRCGEKSYPQLAQTLKDHCLALDVAVPELYVRRAPEPIAELLGEEHPQVLLSTGMLELLSEREMSVLLAQQAAHLHCGHELFLLTRALLASAADNMGILKGVIAPVRMMLEEWVTVAMLSCDRGALLLTDDLEAILSLLTKLAGGGVNAYGGVTPESLLDQYASFRCLKEETPACPVFKTWSSLYLQMPGYALRAGEIKRWQEAGGVESFARGEGHKAADPTAEMSEEQARAYWGEFAGEGMAWESAEIDEGIIFGEGGWDEFKRRAEKMATGAEGVLRSGLREGANLAARTMGNLAESLFKYADKSEKK